MTAAAFPSWQPRPEVWLLVAGLIGLGVYAARVIQPKAVAAGGEPISRNQKLWFVLGVEVIKIPEELVESVNGRQKLVAVAEMVLTELPGHIAERLQQVSAPGAERDHGDIGFEAP